MNKAEYWNYINRKRSNYYKKFRLEAEAILKKDINKITNLKDYKDNKRIDKVFKESEKEWTKYFKALSDTVITEFHSKIKTKSQESEIRDKINQYLKEKCGDKIKGITESSRKLIMDKISEGVKEGLSDYEISKLIKDDIEQRYYNRALTISRTEVGRASNYGLIIGAEDNGMDTKEWVACADDRCREWHLEADTQKVPIDENFIVNGEEIFMPGDGSPENSINCRCCVNFHKLKKEVR